MVVDVTTQTVGSASSDITTIYGGAPSAGDISEHTRAFQQGVAKDGVRSIMVDNSSIQLYNSSANQTIKIPRPQ